MSIRLVMAETLKLRKSRGLLIATVLMNLGVGVLVVLIPEFYRLAHPSAGVAGGQQGLQRVAIAVGFIGSIAAMLVGTAAGTGDLSTGIFRDMVATGKSRAALFGARVPGALVYWVPLLTLSYVVSALLDFAFSNHGGAATVAGSLNPQAAAYFNGSAPAVHQYLYWYLWLLVYTGFVVVVSLGLSSWIGSRAITLGVLITFQLFVAPILSNITPLGAVREFLYPQSIAYITPSEGPGGAVHHAFGLPVTSSLWIAWLVLVVWVVLAVAAGLWRTLVRDA